MQSNASLVNGELLRCHLRSLIMLCGVKIPPAYKVHPSPEHLALPDLQLAVDFYRSFLRSPRSLS